MFTNNIMSYNIMSLKRHWSDELVVRAPALQLEGHGFEPWPSHTKDFKMVPTAFLSGT